MISIVIYCKQILDRGANCIKLEKTEDALPLAKALCEGGLPCAEVTFRTDVCADIAPDKSAYPAIPQKYLPDRKWCKKLKKRPLKRALR